MRAFKTFLILTLEKLKLKKASTVLSERYLLKSLLKWYGNNVMSKQKAQYLIKTGSNLLFGHSLPLFSIKPKKIIMLTGNWKLFSV